MLTKQFDFSPISMKIQMDSILRIMKVPENKSDEYTRNLIEELFLQAQEISAPGATFSISENPKFDNSGLMILENHRFFLGKMVQSAIKKSSSIAIFIATAGKKVESLAKKLQLENHFLEALILDIIGSEIAEAAAAQIHQMIGEEMAINDLKITNRYSPGYCNWPVSDQQKLFSILGNKTYGVKLTDSSLMMPIKSVSGIIGIGQLVKNREYSCSKCEIGECIHFDKKN